MLPYASLKITFSFIIIILLSDLEKINNLVNITYYSYHSKFVQLSSKIIFYSRYVLLSQDHKPLLAFVMFPRPSFVKLEHPLSHFTLAFFKKQGQLS